MNYYNPYFLPMGYSLPTASKSLLGGLFRNGFSFSGLLSGTQKTLNVVNQALPLIKQASPIFKNAKTMFRVLNEFKKVDTPSSFTNDESVLKDVKAEPVSTGNPTFFQ